MLRLPSYSRLPTIRRVQLQLWTGVRLYSSRNQPHEPSEDDVRAARSWLQKLDAETIPKSICELSFSRSSGPGGQNVNKVNSKATLKVGLDSLLKHVPNALHSEIRCSRYVAARSDSIIIQADDSRKQTDNALSCYARLHQVIVEAGKKALPGETSAEQAKRVQTLWVS
jgi:peptidyl-tRNA hydrolase ICT1